MFLECAGCHHPYDVSSYDAGQKLRCHCGQILVVPKESQEIYKAHTLHCSNCGGQLKKGQPNCPFCNALVDLTHARMTAYCTSCLAMSRENAKFCSGCGKPLVSNAGSPKEATENCPRCRVKMRRRELGSHSPLECPMCCGLFVEIDTLGEMIEKQKDTGLINSGVPGSNPTKATLKHETVTYVKCPVCETVMNRLNYGRISGVIVDYCRKHGYWLDAGELEKIAQWVSTGGLEKQKAREAEEMKADQSRTTKTTTESFRMGQMGDEGYGLERGTRGADIAGGLMNLVGKLFDI